MKKEKKKSGQILLHIMLICFGIASIIPFLSMIATAMTPHSFTMPYPPKILPDRLYFENFINAWNSNCFGKYFFNSILVSVVSTLIIILISSMSAYGFARMQFPGKNILFYLLMFSMMVPTVTNLVSIFILTKNLHLVDSYIGLMLVYIGTGIASNTFFPEEFFLKFSERTGGSGYYRWRWALDYFFKNCASVVGSGHRNFCYFSFFKCVG